MSRWQIAVAEVRTRHLFMVLPSYTGQIWVPTALSLFQAMWKFRERKGIRIEFYPIMFNAQIWMSRSQAATMFLASQATDMLMCDWDLMFQSEAFLQLLDHPVDVVGCDYPRRMEPINYSTRFIRKSDRSFDFTRDERGLIEVEAVPTGLMRVSRNCIEQMVEAYPDLQYHDETMPNKTGFGLFSNILENKRTWGEDISFCKRWRDIGGKIYLDPGIAVSHWGSKQFVGNFEQWLAEMANADPDDLRFID